MVLSMKAMKVMKKPSTMKKPAAAKADVFKLQVTTYKGAEKVENFNVLIGGTKQDIKGKTIMCLPADCTIGELLRGTMEMHDMDDYEEAKQAVIFNHTHVEIDNWNYDPAVDDALLVLRDLTKDDGVVKFTFPAALNPAWLEEARMEFGNEDTMAEAVPEVKIVTEAKHSMPPPTGTFLK